MGKKITLELPDRIEITEQEVVLMIAAHLYEDGRLSLGQGADLAGMDKRTFAGSLGRFNVSIFNSVVSGENQESAISHAGAQAGQGSGFERRKGGSPSRL